MKNVLMAVADRGDGDGRGMMGGGRDGFDGGPLMVVCLVVLVAAVAAVAWLLVRRRGTAPATTAPVAPAPQAPSPLAGAEAILAERLARGELSPDDYRAAAAALRGQPVDLPVGSSIASSV